jgi:hypothetical protein
MQLPAPLVMLLHRAARPPLRARLPLPRLRIHHVRRRPEGSTQHQHPGRAALRPLRVQVPL